MDLNNLFNQSRFNEYAAFLKSTNLSDTSIQRKLSSLASFQKFLIKKKLINDVRVNRCVDSSLLALPAKSTQKISFFSNLKSKIKLPPIADNLRSNFLFRYIVIFSLFAISAGLGFTLYRQAILQSQQNLAYSTASAMITGGRFLSFQGRLTDTAGNPIISSTGIVFKLYPSVGSGTTLYTSQTGNSQTVVPDENGIFSVTIGKSHGTTIPSSVFTENAEVWLEITAGGETMNPRQQIATVGYALNSETLQGLPPSASGTKNTVLVIDGSGNLNLGETSPTIKSTSGTLGIEGQAVLIKASDGSGGNVTINPDSNGVINLITEGTGATGFINATNANLTSGNLFNATINNLNRGYNFINFSNYSVGTSIISRFSVDAYGNTIIGNNLTVGGTFVSVGSTNLVTNLNSDYFDSHDSNYFINIGQTGSLPYVNDATNSTLTRSGSSPYTLGLNLGNSNTWTALQTFTAGIGVSNTVNFTNNLNVGGTAFFNSYVGIGTTPTAALDVKATSGNILQLADQTQVRFVFQPDTGGGSNVLFKSGIASMTSEGTWEVVSAASNLIKMRETGSGNEINFDPSAGAVYTNNTNNLTLGSNTNMSQLVLQNGGNVGIGTSNPTEKLSVIGNEYLSGNLTIGGTFVSVGSTNLVTNLNANYLNGIPSNGFVEIGNTGNFITTLTNGVGITITGSGSSRNIAFDYGSSLLATGNKIGLNLGSTNTWTAQQTFGNASIGGTLVLTQGAQDGYILTSDASGNSYWAPNNSSGGAIYFAGSGLTLNSTTFKLGGTLTENTNLTIGDTSAFFINFTNGNIGLGTTDPGQKLDVIGNIRTNGQLISTVAQGTAPLSIGSSTIINYLNADLLDGQHASNFTSSSTNLFYLTADSGGTLPVNVGTSINFVGGMGLGSTLAAGKTITFNIGSSAGISVNADTIGVDIGYSGLGFSGNQLINSGLINVTNNTLSRAGSVGNYTVGLNLGSSNTWTAPQTFNGGFDSNADSSITNLFIDGSGIGINMTNNSLTTDISLQNGETIDNDTNGTINFSNSNLSLSGTIFLTSGRLFRANDGNVNGPAYGFSNDTDQNTGIYRIGEDNLGIGTSGILRIAVTGNGKVGIGTSSPGEKLTIDNGTILVYKTLDGADYQGLVIGRTGSWSSDVGKYADITFTNASSNTNTMGSLGMTYDGSYSRMDFHSFYNGSYGATGALMSIRGDGNIGIGTTGPSQKLDVEIQTTDGVNGTVANSYPIADFTNQGSGGGLRGLQIGAPTGSVASPVYLKVNGTTSRFSIINNSNVENLTILDSGNVGIGTTNPGAKLQINSPNNQAYASVLSLRQGASPTYGFDFLQDDLTTGDLQLNRVNAGVSSQMMTFQRNTGNVGINNTNPSYGLSVGSLIGADLNGNLMAQQFLDIGDTRYFLNPANTSSTNSSLSLTSTGSIRFNYKDSDGTYAQTGIASRIQNLGTGLALDVGTSNTGTVTWNSNLFLSMSGNVGVGTTDPKGSLQIRAIGDSGDVFSGIRVYPASADGTAVSNYQRITGFRHSGLALSGSGTGSNYTKSYIFLDDSGISLASSDGVSIDPLNNVNLKMLNNGNVGIGTTDPGIYKLYVANGTGSNVESTFDVGYPNASSNFGAIDIFGSGSNTVGDGISYIFSALDSGNARQEYAGISGQIESNTAGSEKGNLAFLTTDNGNARTEKMRITSNGNVGIGTANPQYGRLEITTTASNTGGLTLYRGTGTTARSWISSNDVWLMQRAATDTAGIAINNTGNVGIGTTNPIAKLNVYGQSLFGTTRTGVGAASSVINLGSDEYINFAWSTNYPTGNYHRIGKDRTFDNYALSYISTGADAATNLAHVFRTTNTDSALAITAGGNIGIGTISPGTKLAVIGDITRTNTRSNGGQYPVGRSLTDGETMFAIDPTWSNVELQKYFNSTGVTWYNDSTAPGGYAIQINGPVYVSGGYSSGFPYIPVESDAIYYMEVWAKKDSGSTCNYMGSEDFNESFVSLGGNPGSYGYFLWSCTNVASTWTKYSAYIGGFGNSVGQFKTGTKYWTPEALFNYSSGGNMYISGWKVVKITTQGNRAFLNGNVGIGTASPSEKLEINGNLKFTVANPYITASSYFTAPGGAYFNSGTVYTEAAIQARGGIQDDTHSYLSILGGRSNFTYFPGNIGLGVASSDYKLDVRGPLGKYAIYAVGNSGPAVIAATTNNSDTVMYINNSGNGRGIIAYTQGGTGLTVYAQAGGGVYGNSYSGVGIDGYSQTGIGVRGGVYSGWAAYFSGSGYISASAWTYGSDRRLKENIQYFSDKNLSALDLLKQLKPASFDYINHNTGVNEDGFIAQDVQAILPNLVTFNEENGMLGLKTTNLIPYLVKGIQEQQIEIDELNTDLSITSTGQINVDMNVSNGVLTSLGYHGSKNEIESASYSLTDSIGNVVTRVSQFNKVISAKIQTGLLTATNIISTNLVSKNIIADKIVSPKGNFENITASNIQSTNVETTNLSANTATVSTLYADNIISKEGSIGELMTAKVSALRDELQKLVASKESSSSSITGSSILSQSSNWSMDIASDSAKITGDLELGNNLIVGANLTIHGDTQLGDAFISGTFTVGEIAIKDNFIETTNTALYIQPSKNGSVHIMGDTLVIADDGSVQINGNLTVSGSLMANLIVADQIQANKLTAKEVSSNEIKIATDSAQTIVAESGFEQIATSSAKLTSNATAGTATLPTGKTELVITNNKITPNSMVYLTPVGSTNNQVLYVKTKMVYSEAQLLANPTLQNYFTIAIDNYLDKDIDINWWIIN